MSPNEEKNNQIIGLMSGTSLDGLDMALCEFKNVGRQVNFKIIKAETIPYNANWKNNLSQAKHLSTEAFFQLHSQYGKWMATEVNWFLSKNNLKVDAIASHGHTVYHQPQFGFTTQIGCGANLAAATKIKTVCDFRSMDVALKGQGAPLVPIGDELLFGEYAACLNIGGIANISFRENGKRLAYDVCEANMLLNYLSEKLGKVYDECGAIARSGQVNLNLLKVLNDLPFYKINKAKSLGREWFENEVLTLINKFNLKNEDLLATAVEHIATIISNELNEKKLTNVLVSGGGAFNNFLIERMQAKTDCKLVIPTNEIINFKEALIFAFLGYLRLNHQVNTLASVTGASANSIGGAVYLGF